MQEPVTLPDTQVASRECSPSCLGAGRRWLLPKFGQPTDYSAPPAGTMATNRPEMMPKGAAVPLYLLEPVRARLSDPAWSASAHRSYCIVAALSERQARELAARELASGGAAAGQARAGLGAYRGSLGAAPRWWAGEEPPSMPSPWLQVRLVEAREMPLAAAMLAEGSDGPAAAPAAPCIVIPEPKAPPAPTAAAADQQAKAATASRPASVPKRRGAPAKAAAAAKADAAARGQAKRKPQHHARKAATRSGDRRRTGRLSGKVRAQAGPSRRPKRTASRPRALVRASGSPKRRTTAAKTVARRAAGPKPHSRRPKR